MFLLIMLQVLFLFSGVFIAFYFLWNYRASYWKRRGIPSPAAKLFSGNLDDIFWEKNLRLFQTAKWTEQYGKIYGLMQGWQPLLVISDPEMVQELLINKFDCFHGRVLSSLDGDVDMDPNIHMFFARGARWKRLRATANPAFSVRNLKKIMPTVYDSINVAIDLIEKERSARPNAAINLHRYFAEMTYDVIARVAMGQRESRQFRSEEAKLSMRAFQTFQNNWIDYLAVLFPLLGSSVLRPFIRLTGKMLGNPMVLIADNTRKAVDERRRTRHEQQEQTTKVGDSDKNGTDQHDQTAHDDGDVDRKHSPVDFIDLFLDAITEEENILYKNQPDVFNKSQTKVDRMNSVEEIATQLQMFLLAGFDTTANSMGFVMYNLACHPTVQMKVQDEIDTVCMNEYPTFEELSQLKYTEATIKETLRLLPIVGGGVTRLCSKTTTLGDLTVEKGIGVTIDQYTLHRDKQLWGDDADEFRPERWLDNDRLPSSAHFYAFGGGPRICLGMRFALLEEKMAFARLLRRYSLVKTEETEKSLKINSQVVLNPGAVMVRLEVRSGFSDE